MILGIAKFSKDEIIGVTLDGTLNIWNLEGGELQTKQVFGHRVSVRAYILVRRECA